ncbi:enoyl-CoA hydratase-related protein [Pollutimonas sp. M17]|uniref:enoyl-CoA hydratase-related protein n=1 Tax=Pollutimonas sp. M17 TaxID=2962065 RepID=UPI0021F4DA35|nr:enoyl-CoA hydratase-related protein [Pollutimonas sp. M17]UYO93029.1 enoyl-CoA hydratase-related protein [Pollutimonas sp. M17]
MTNSIQVAKKDHVATVLLNRPDKMNALDYDGWIQLDQALRALSDDDDVRCIVLSGAGGRAFSSGADISEFTTRRQNAEQAAAYGVVTQSAMDALATCRHPTIAMITGVCVGGGLELASVCDLRYSNASGRFGVPVNKLGLVLSYGEMRGLVRVVGTAIAMEIVLEGRVFDAEEAQDKRLINRIYPDEALEGAVMDIANTIAERAPLVNRWHKKFSRRLLDPAEITPEEWKESYACFDTEDFQIGYQAFLNKEKPQFKGR